MHFMHRPPALAFGVEAAPWGMTWATCGDGDNGGNDFMTGGGGKDRLLARDGSRDSVNCGGGKDVAVVDNSDRVSRNCETVRRP